MSFYRDLCQIEHQWFSDCWSCSQPLMTLNKFPHTLIFHYQLMHTTKTLSQFSFKTIHVKNVCDAY